MVRFARTFARESDVLVNVLALRVELHAQENAALTGAKVQVVRVVAVELR